jgi:proline iminopeptidase
MRHATPPMGLRTPQPDEGRTAVAGSGSDGAGARVRAVLDRGRRDRRGVVAAGLAIPVLWALLAGWWMPRGPVTTGQALAVMAIGLAVGAGAGLLLRSRWALLVTPLVFATVFEVVRLGSAGPTVDGIHVSTYGLLAFAVGRGFHGVVGLLPMVLGAVLGAGVARRRSSPPVGTPGGGGPRRSAMSRAGVYARRTVAAATATALLLLAVALARPAGTDPITGPDGTRLSGSVAELTRVRIGGHDLAMMIRGRSADNPVLLFLAGGPGGTELGAMRHHGQALEDDFVVVTWDQRGTGRSYDQLEPTSTLTLANAVRDTIEVTDYLRDRFGQDKIYLLGQSWGTILGVLSVQQRPELFHAFIGAGQMVSPRATDLVFYRDSLAWAQRTGNTTLAATLIRNGPPPYQSALAYEPALSYESELYPYDRSRNAEGEGQMSEGIFVGEYALIDQVHNLGAVVDTLALLYPQIQHIDFRTQATRLEVPVYLFQGRHEAPGRADLAEEWFGMLSAPRKQLSVAETSGHRPLFEQPDAFHAFMTGVVLDDRGAGVS